MALIALAADKGSPGVTTAALALAATWPRRTLLAEVDPAGGDLVYRSSAQSGGSLDPNTGMLSLAATARRGLAAGQLWDHAQRLTGGLDVLVGLGNAEQSVGLRGHWGELGRACAELNESPDAGTAADVIADCGRIGPESPVLDLLRHAVLVLLVAGSSPEQIARVRDRAAAMSATLHGTDGGGALRMGMPAIGVLVVGDAQSGARLAGQVNNMLIASNCGARVVGFVAHDVPGAEQLAGRRRGRVEKSLLIRSIRKVVEDVQRGYAAVLAPQAQPAAERTSGGGPAAAGQPYPQPVQAPPQQPYTPGPAGPHYGYPQAQRQPQQPYVAQPQPQPQPQPPAGAGRPSYPAGPPGATP